MFSNCFFQYPCVREYRKALVLQILLIVMIFVDILAFVFAPFWTFLFFVALHAAVIVFWIRAKCRLLDAFLIDLFE